MHTPSCAGETPVGWQTTTAGTPHPLSAPTPTAPPRPIATKKRCKRLSPDRSRRGADRATTPRNTNTHQTTFYRDSNKKAHLYCTRNRCDHTFNEALSMIQLSHSLRKTHTGQPASHRKARPAARPRAAFTSLRTRDSTRNAWTMIYVAKKGCCASNAAERGRTWRSITSIWHRRSTAVADIREVRLNLSSITPAPCCSKTV